MTEPSSDLVKLVFGVHKSLRYHAKRRSFFEALHRASVAIIAIGGTSAFVTIVQGQPEVGKWIALVLAIVALLDVVIGYAEHARRHDSLYWRFSDLAADIARTGEPSEENIRLWLERRLLVEKDEPTLIAALNVRCHNEEAQARGYGPDHLYRVRWYQAAFSHFLTLPPHNFKPLES